MFRFSYNIYSTNNHICIQSLSPEFRDVVIDEKSVIPYLNKLKRKQFPKSPKTVQEIINAFKEEEIQKLYGKYYVHTQKPVQSPGKKYGFTILCDRNILKVIEQFPSQEILMDGTFEIVKRGPYKQLLVIYCAVKGEVSSFLHKDCWTYNIHIRQIVLNFLSDSTFHICIYGVEIYKQLCPIVQLHRGKSPET